MNSVTEIKNTLEAISSRLEEAENGSASWKTVLESNQAEHQKDKGKRRIG